MWNAERLDRLEPAFLALLSVQALHSVEEYPGRLYGVFPPARVVAKRLVTASD